MNRNAHRIVTQAGFVARYTSAVHCEFESHCHPNLTVTTVLSGVLEAEIGSAKLAVNSGQSVFTDRLQTHSARGIDVEFLSVGVSAAVMNAAAAESGLISSGAGIAFRHVVARDKTVYDIARGLAAEMETEEPGREAMLEALVSQLVIVLLRSHLLVRKSPLIELSRAGPVDRRLRRAIEFMHDNYSREIGIGEIAQAAYVSEYHFARLFKRITGVTPHTYLANLRLERARELLITTARPISEIAGMVGYQSQSHFTKAFKAITGLTPRGYREGKCAGSSISGDYVPEVTSGHTVGSRE